MIEIKDSALKTVYHCFIMDIVSEINTGQYEILVL